MAVHEMSFTRKTHRYSAKLLVSLAMLAAISLAGCVPDCALGEVS